MSCKKFKELDLFFFCGNCVKVSGTHMISHKFLLLIIQFFVVFDILYTKVFCKNLIISFKSMLEQTELMLSEADPVKM